VCVLLWVWAEVRDAFWAMSIIIHFTHSRLSSMLYIDHVLLLGKEMVFAYLRILFTVHRTICVKCAWAKQVCIVEADATPPRQECKSYDDEAYMLILAKRRLINL